MINGDKILAIVPARGGSKGIPRKNIKPINGKPLIAYTIDQALQVPELDYLVVTTDDSEIQSVAASYGVNVINRPSQLATDEARSEPMMIHALDRAESLTGTQFDYVVLLQPTSPLRSLVTITECLNLLVGQKGKSLVTVSELNELIGELTGVHFKTLFPEDRRRRQDRHPKYKLNGSVFACSASHLRETGELMTEEWMCYVIDGPETVDIDSIDDFEYAEFLLKKQELSNG